MGIPCCTSRSKLSRFGISPILTSGTPVMPVAQCLLFNQISTGGSLTDLLDLAEELGGFGSLVGGVDAVVTNVKRVNTTAEMQPTPLEWAALLPAIMYTLPTGAGSVGSPWQYSLSTNPTVFGLAMDFDGGGGYFQFPANIVSSFKLSGQAGSPLKVSLRFAGTDYSRASSGYPTLAFPTGQPFIFKQGTCVFGNSIGAVKVESFRLDLDHMVDNNRFFMGGDTSCPVNQGQKVDINLTFPLGCNPELLDAGFAAGGVSIVLTFTAGTAVLKFTMPAVKAAYPEISAQVPREIVPSWAGMAKAMSSTPFLPALIAQLNN
jgi:hypothetical protein